MSRSFTKREKVLLCVLAVMLIGAIYYLLVYQTYSTGMQKAENDLYNAQTDYDTETIKAVRLKQMEQELETLKSSDNAKSEIPQYDNINNVMQFLNSAMSSSESFGINFSDINQDDALIRRNVELSFVCSGYEEAKETLMKFYNCKYRCIIGNLSINETADTENDNSSVAVVLSVTFLENK